MKGGNEDDCPFQWHQVEALLWSMASSWSAARCKKAALSLYPANNIDKKLGMVNTHPKTTGMLNRQHYKIQVCPLITS